MGGGRRGVCHPRAMSTELERLADAIAQLEQRFALQQLACQGALGRLEGPLASVAPVHVPDADTARAPREELASLLGGGVFTVRQWVGKLARLDLLMLTGGRFSELDPEGPLMRRLTALRDAGLWDDATELASAIRDFSDPR